MSETARRPGRQYPQRPVVVDLQGLRPPREPDDFPQHQREAERHHQKGAGVAPVEAPQKKELEQHADQTHCSGASSSAARKLPVARATE